MPVTDSRDNQLLWTLCECELPEWGPHLESIDLTLGRILPEPGSNITVIDLGGLKKAHL